MPSAPRVSCVMPAYNYERFIGPAIESVLAQDYPSDALELVVVDDGSTDGTPDVVEPYRDRIRYVRKENGGINSAVNRALEEATGDYVAFLDADDLWPPHKTRRQVEFLEAHPEVGLLHADMEVVDVDGNPIAASFFKAFGLEPQRGRVLGPLLSRNFVSGGAIVMRAALRPLYYPLPPEVAWTDWWFAVRIAAVADIDHLPEPLYRYRYHGENEIFLARGERLTSVLRDRELPWRRWMLSHVEPGQASAADLVRAWHALQETLAKVAADTGLAPQEIVAVDQDRRHHADAATERARAALAEGDLDAVACHLVHALAHDPSHAWAGARLGSLAGSLLPADPKRPAAPGPGTLPEDLRAFVTLAFAEEVAEDPGLLAAYGAVFSGDDDATLLICAPGWAPAEAAERLGQAVGSAGLDGEQSADLLAYPSAPGSETEPVLAERVDAVLSRRPLAGALAARPRVDDRDLTELRELAELRWAAARTAA